MKKKKEIYHSTGFFSLLLHGNVQVNLVFRKMSVEVLHNIVVRSGIYLQFFFSLLQERRRRRKAVS